MSGVDLPPEDDDWLDEAILIAILAIQFGNASARRASFAMGDSMRSEVRNAILDMGRRPAPRAIRRAVARIDRAVRRASRITKRVILGDVKTLVGMERKSLPDGIDKPATAALLASIRSRAVLGRTLDEYVTQWLTEIPSDRITARVKHLASTGAAPKAIWSQVSNEVARVSTAAGNVARTITADASTAVRTIAAGKGQRLVWISVLDDRTTIQCINLDGDTWLEGEDHLYPPIHIGCRSSVGIHMGGDVDKRDYIDWLRKQGVPTQNAVLGSERAAAWRAGKLTISQMVDGTKTRVITLDTLRKMGRL